LVRAPAAFETRNSNGLTQFCSSLEERPGLSILDFAPASQSTVSFITGYGHRLYSDDFVHQLDQCFGASGEFFENQSNPLLTARFLDTAMDFDDQSFDGALVWDSLQFLTPTLLQAVVNRLHRILRPGSSLLSIFHAEERVDEISTFSYRIQDHRTVLMAQRSRRKPAQIFNNRNLEKLFQDFASVKFFLTRDHLREVIVKR
jgi:SAM-dependent methyltransferase